MKKPLVSIIIPVYNGSNYIKEAIDSALAQTYDNLEILVINDGSTDNTDSIVKSYKNRIRYYKKENGGVSSALNMGIAKMKGDYFSWLSHDDIYFPEKISKQMEHIASTNYIVKACYCDFCHINNQSHIITSIDRNNDLSDGQILSWDNALKKLFLDGSMNGCSFLIKKDVFDTIGLFDEKLLFSQDTLMWINMFLNKNSIIYCGEKLVCNRVHKSQVTQVKKDMFYKDSLYISTILLKKIIDVSNKKENFYYYYLKMNAVFGVKDVIKNGFRLNKQIKVLSLFQIIKIYLCYVYGLIRPIIKNIYYKFFKKTNI